MNAIKTVLVMGAGTMGSGIARLFKMNGFNVRVVDPFEANLKRTQKLARLSDDSVITTFTEAAVRNVDCIIEAVTENIQLKQDTVYQPISKFFEHGLIKNSILIGSNTSSIPILKLSETLPKKIQPNFMGVHFFNPAHYMKLIELIPSKTTSEETKNLFYTLAKSKLNKEIAVAADLPGFIVNRLLVFDYGNVLHDVANKRFTIEEIDAVLATPVGRPMGPFVLADLVGIDLLQPIGKIIYDGVPEDPQRAHFLLPKFVQDIVEKKYLGAKTNGLGFYRVENRKPTAVYDIFKGDYRPIDRPTFKSIQDAATEKDVILRIKKLLYSKHDDRGREIARHYLKNLSQYALGLVNTIGSENDIETAMIYGLNHRVGPIGLTKSELGKEWLSL